MEKALRQSNDGTELCTPKKRDAEADDSADEFAHYAAFASVFAAITERLTKGIECVAAMRDVLSALNASRTIDELKTKVDDDCPKYLYRLKLRAQHDAYDLRVMAKVEERFHDPDPDDLIDSHYPTGLSDRLGAEPLANDLRALAESYAAAAELLRELPLDMANLFRKAAGDAPASALTTGPSTAHRLVDTTLTELPPR